MFCKNCGKELKEGARFCNKCGACLVYKKNKNMFESSKNDKNNRQQDKMKSQEKTKNKSTSILIGWAGIIAVILGLAIFVIICINNSSNSNINYSNTNNYEKDLKEVIAIRNSHFKEYPQSEGYLSIGDACDSYFEYIKWTYSYGDDYCDVIELCGTFSNNDKKTDCTINFELDNNNDVKIESIKLDGDFLYRYEIENFIRDMMIKTKNTSENN